MNFYNVKVEQDGITFSDGKSIRLPDAVMAKLQGRNRVIMGIRGEDIKFDSQNLDLYNDTRQQSVIDNTEIMGNENNLYFEFGGIISVARVSKYEVSKIGDVVDFVMMPQKMHFFDEETERAVF